MSPRLRFNKQTNQLEPLPATSADVTLYPPSLLRYGASQLAQNLDQVQLPSIYVTEFTGGRGPANRLNDVAAPDPNAADPRHTVNPPRALLGGDALQAADLSAAQEQLTRMFFDHYEPEFNPNAPGKLACRDEQGRDVSWVTWEWITTKVAGRPISQKILDTLTQQYWDRIRYQAQILLGPFAVAVPTGGHPVITVHPKSSYQSTNRQPGIHYAPTSVATVEGLPPVSEWSQPKHKGLLEAWREFEAWAGTAPKEVNQQLMLIYLTKYANDHVTELARERLHPNPNSTNWIDGGRFLWSNKP